jgi:hypothetical protein
MNVNLVQYYKNGDGWELETLTEDEAQQVYKAIREKNKKIFSECMEDAEDIMGEYQGIRNNSLALVTQVAQQLFERRAIHISVILDAALKRKVFDIRRNGTHSCQQEFE